MVVETVRVLDVEEATRLVRLVEVATPLIVVVRILPEVERAFEVMMLEVAVTPFTVDVRMLPMALWVKELMMFAREELTPFTIVWKRLAEEEAVFEVMTEVVPIDPPMFEVSVLVATVRELEVRMLGAVRLVTVAFVVVEFPTMRLVKLARDATRLEKKPLVLVLLVEKRLVAVRAEDDALPSTV